MGREFTISVKRYGHTVVAADNYPNAPAMQVADDFRMVNMLDADALDAVVAEVQPDIIVPEIEAIRTEQLFKYEAEGIHVVPSANAANMTMNRKAIRDLASQTLGLKTAKYAYAATQEEFVQAVQEVGIPCVVKPLMSSSGKGQSVIRTAADVQHAFDYGMEGSRGDIRELIVEEFIEFESEITLLTVTQRNGNTVYCPPIGHRQERGDYQESWMPHSMDEVLLKKAQDMADAVTAALGGQGLWGVEFFIGKTEVYFSELSPRPHDTGMVTLGGCTELSEFELHARAILGYPIAPIALKRQAASAVILAEQDSVSAPTYHGIDQALTDPNVEIRIFGKPSTRPFRRMGVAVAFSDEGVPMDTLRNSAIKAAKAITITYR